MRLWSIRPDLLDRMGLLALWREGLLAQKILLAGPPYDVPYGKHPQLDRFKKTSDPINMIGRYLRHVYEEARRRGYNFNRKLIHSPTPSCTSSIPVSIGQIDYEMRLLLHKLKSRDQRKWGEVHSEVERLQGYYQGPAFQRGLLAYSFTLNPTKKYPEPWEKVKEF